MNYSLEIPIRQKNICLRLCYAPGLLFTYNCFRVCPSLKMVWVATREEQSSAGILTGLKKYNIEHIKIYLNDF